MGNKVTFTTVPNLKAAPATPVVKASQGNATPPTTDVAESQSAYQGIYKAYIPEFLYKPPFGYPRPEPIPLIKQFAKNPYIFSVINALQEEAASSAWEIIPRSDDVPMTPEMKAKAEKIIQFFNNPNTNKQSFSHMLKTAVRDIAVVDAGVWQKVFNKNGQFVCIVPVDGGSILINPDIYGNIGERADIIFPTNIAELKKSYENPIQKNEGLDAINAGMIMSAREIVTNQYGMMYGDEAAYFQYGWTIASLPVPFGKQELIYMMKNPQAGSIYGISPIAILADTILTLVYGLNYNLDYYMNSNIPEGIISIEGADAETIKGFKARMEDTIREKDPLTGFPRKVNFKAPVTNTKADFIAFQLPSKDMQIIEQQSWFTKLVWMCFGLSEEDLGITSDSNNAVSQTMFKRYTRKAVRPILRLLAERINMEIMPELNPEGDLQFKWDDYDLEEDIQRHTLYEMQIRMGIKTPEMVAKEEKIDLTELKKSKQENQDFEVAGEIAKNPPEKATASLKSNKLEFTGNPIETDVVDALALSADSIMNDLDKQKAGTLSNVS